jgi:hypothetical protein
VWWENGVSINNLKGVGQTMKNLSMICTVMLFILSAGQAFALPGIYNAGSSTMNLVQDECEIRTISMDGTGWGTSPLMSGGFCISLSDSSKITINDIWCYDEPPLLFWPTVEIIPDPDFTCVITGNPDEGVPPSSTMLICDVAFCGAALGSSTITIDTIPEWDTWVAQDFTVYDSTIDPEVIEAHVWGNPCECVMDGPLRVRASALHATQAQYTAIPDQDCSDMPVYQYNITCDGWSGATIDTNTGLLTVPPYTGFDENCDVCVLDTANSDINTGDPVECCLNIEISSDW